MGPRSLPPPRPTTNRGAPFAVRVYGRVAHGLGLPVGGVEHGRPHTQVQMGSADPPPGKTDEKLKSENMQKEHFSVLQNAPFRSQIFKVFFASGSREKLTP